MLRFEDQPTLGEKTNSIPTHAFRLALYFIWPDLQGYRNC